jgi:hypothetical protein
MQVEMSGASGKTSRQDKLEYDGRVLLVNQMKPIILLKRESWGERCIAHLK